MFLKLLKKLATEYKAGETYFGGDVEADLTSPETLGMQFSESRRYFGILGGMTQALYDLGVLVALPAPADGEVYVHTNRAKQLFTLVELWSVGAEVLVAKVIRKRAEPIVLEACENLVKDPTP